MKKIFILFAALSLLVGCASKPKEGKYAREARLQAEKAESEQVKTIKQLVYAPTVSLDELEEARKIAWSGIDKEKLEEKRAFYSSKTKRKDFTGKIINETNEEVHLRVFPRGTYTYDLEINNLPDVDFIIPPQQTYYFKIENFFVVGENMFAIQKMNENRSYAGGYILSYGDETCNDSHLFFPVVEECLKSHSIELFYDHSPSDNYSIKSYRHQFVKPFDDKIQDEKNLIIIHQPVK